MKLRIALSAFVFAALPAVGFAECGWQQHAMSCAEGSVYDTKTATCVAVVTS
ncbi:hypothetical protein SAMN04488040_1642 [Sulfitobacter marinus]|uniref:Chitin binding Peritrophin-A domain-containing protein n=1 Tax=Sulfitobacter marinus TaxID=394264 RepID=A0A1I6RXK2_9RHOB|nr:hypothetical protein [Sulfitobacter marinus]SFS69424.1 hypothetical protein SAMN04488040_1642 [Sulfitobacter marinus]